MPGFIGSADAQPNFRGMNQQAMYSHGFGCLFLSEVCGMLPDKARQRKVKDVLDQAIAFTVEARNKEGGWRYDVRPQIADVSVTVAQMMALRAAKNAGVFVRKNVIDDGVAYIKGCQMPDGGFSYFKGQGYSAFARSAAAMVGGSPWVRPAPATSRKASSRESGSTSGVTERRIAMTDRLAASYASKRGGRKTASGQRRRARALGMALCTPNALAS